MATKIKSLTSLEERFNSISHGITAVMAIAGLVILIVFGVQSDKDWSLFSGLVYGCSLLLLYTFSALYHGLRNKKTKHLFNILDHCGIYLLVAGNYTSMVLIIFGIWLVGFILEYSGGWLCLALFLKYSILENTIWSQL